MPERELRAVIERSFDPPLWLRYGFALLTLALAVLLRMPFEGYLQSKSPFLTFIIAVIAAAWYGGLGPAIASLVVGGILASYFIIEPSHGPQFMDISDFASLLLYAVVGISTALISEAQRKAKHQATRFAKTAMQRQQELTIEVSRREEAETELQRVVTELERSNRELQDFAFVASHDLQEPLRKILAFGERLSLRYSADLGEEGSDYLQRMLNASSRMQALINDLLNFSRVTSKAQPPELVDLNVVIREVVDNLQAIVEASGAKIEVGELPTIQADRSQMRQLFQNLVGNAVKFQPPDRTPVVKVHARRLEGSKARWEIDVVDNGIGFDEKHLDRIFTIFQRLHGRGEYEGSGIGLSICRKIVERHGGAITAESKLDQGATFKVVLPERQESFRG